ECVRDFMPYGEPGAGRWTVLVPDDLHLSVFVHPDEGILAQLITTWAHLDSPHPGQDDGIKRRTSPPQTSCLLDEFAGSLSHCLCCVRGLGAHFQKRLDGRV